MMSHTFVALLLGLLCVHLSAGETSRPIIGIIAKPEPEKIPTGQQFSGDYVSWLEQSGARVVPIPFNATRDRLKALFNSINGALFTGGGLSLSPSSTYYQTAKYLFDLAKTANDQGDHFPIWGTCMGFQLLSILAAEDNSVLLENAYDSENLPLPLTMTPQATESRIFGSHMPRSVWDTLTKKAITQNLHHDGVLPETYTKNAKLASIFNLLSTNVDRKGKPFGSTIEGKKYPFFGTQWHPERTQFDWGIQEALAKTPEAYEAVQYVSRFFVDQARKNNHKFPSVAAENQANIHNYPVTYTGNTVVGWPETMTYYMNLTI